MQRQHVERERIPGLHRPLQEIKLLSPLAIASLLGLIGSAVTAAAMLGRVVDGSYTPGGEFYDATVW